MVGTHVALWHKNTRGVRGEGLGGGGGRGEGVRGKKGRILRKKWEWLKRREMRKRNRGEKT